MLRQAVGTSQELRNGNPCHATSTADLPIDINGKQTVMCWQMRQWRIRKIGEDVWVERQLNDGWVVLARVAGQDGRLVIAEIKVSATPVPTGGITQAVLRSIPCGSFGPYLLAQRSLAARLRVGGVLQHFDRIIGVDLPELKGMADRPRPRRKTGRDDKFFAQVAHDYLALNGAGSRRPIQDLATARKLAPSRVRDMVHEARERGLLEKSKSGVRGGRLTPRGDQLLRNREQRK